MAMPTTSSFYPWGDLPIPQTCFQLYGTKRKAAFTDSSTNTEMIMPAVKRHCLRPSLHHYPTSEVENAHHPSQNPCRTDSMQQDSNPSYQPSYQEPTSMQIGGTDCRQSTLAAPSQQVFEEADVQSTSLPHTNGCQAVGHSHGNEQGIDQSACWQESNCHQGSVDQSHTNHLGALEEVEFESNDYWDVPYDHHLMKMADDIERARIAMETEHTPVLDQHQSCARHSETSLVPGLEAHSNGAHIKCYCKASWEGLLEPVSYL